MDEPVILYDGRCRFCTRQIGLLRRLNGGRGRPLSPHDPGVLEQFPGLTLDDCMSEIKLALPDGRCFGGAEAIARALMMRPAWRAVAWLYFIPGVRQLCNAAYRAIAARRNALGGRTCQVVRTPAPADPQTQASTGACDR